LRAMAERHVRRDGALGRDRVHGLPRGDLRLLLQTARLAVEDSRDLKVWAEKLREDAKAIP
jgi:hypothetical protein